MGKAEVPGVGLHVRSWRWPDGAENIKVSDTICLCGVHVPQYGYGGSFYIKILSFLSPCLSLSLCLSLSCFLLLLHVSISAWNGSVLIREMCQFGCVCKCGY